MTSKALHKPAKKCTHCGHKTYGLTWMSVEGWWHNNNRCWNCIEKGGCPWNTEQWVAADTDGTIIILEENHKYTKYFYKNNVR